MNQKNCTSNQPRDIITHNDSFGVWYYRQIWKVMTLHTITGAIL